MVWGDPCGVALHRAGETGIAREFHLTFEPRVVCHYGSLLCVRLQLVAKDGQLWHLDIESPSAHQDSHRGPGG
jgi:hypothetical protein